jgi:hypothetical protein
VCVCVCELPALEASGSCHEVRCQTSHRNDLFTPAATQSFLPFTGAAFVPTLGSSRKPGSRYDSAASSATGLKNVSVGQSHGGCRSVPSMAQCCSTLAYLRIANGMSKQAHRQWHV